MRSLALFSRRRAERAEADVHLSEAQRRRVPERCVAVAEALVAGRSPLPACGVVGRELANDGVSLGEALSALAATHTAVGAGTPAFDATEALAVAWSESTLEFLHEVTCEDPLTGLASSAHLRARIAEVYRGADLAGSSVRTTHALVVVDATPRPGALLEAPAFGRALGLAAVAEALREAFAGEETLARLGTDRVAALVPRAEDLGRSVGRVRAALERLPPPAQARVWIEGLPGRPELVARLLADLTA